MLNNTAHGPARKDRGNQRGQTFVITSFAILVLLVFCGLVADVGMFYRARRQMQTAADAAATAGANALHGSTSVSAGYVTAAQNASKINGFQNATNGITVTASKVACPGAASEQCVKANVTQPVPTYFLKVLGLSTVTVSTEAIAGGVNGPACIFALDPTVTKSFWVAGSGGITSTCGVIVNSSDSQALYGSGSGTYTTTGIGVVGGTHPGSATFTPAPTTGIAPASNPLTGLVAPTAGSCLQTNYSVSGATVTLDHGTYCGGIKATGASHLTFNPGTYILAGGGLTITGSGTLTGSGVTFFVTSGSGYAYKPISMNGSGTVTLSAPTSGSLAGILFFQDPTIFPSGVDNDNTVNGSSTSTYNGVLYFPNSNLIFTGSSNASNNCSGANPGYTFMIADTIKTTGTTQIAVCGDLSALSGVSPIQSSSTYE